MPQNDWQDVLDALVKRSGGSLKGNGSDLAAVLGGGPGGAPAGLDSQAGSTANAADLTERMLAGVAGKLSEQASSLGEKLSELARASQSQVRTLEENTAALGQNSLSRAGEAAKSAVSSIGGFSALSMGPALLPLITSIAKLFGGSKGETASSPAAAFAMPAPLRVEAGIGSGGGGGVSYDANGVPRFDTRRVSETVPPTRWAPEINIQVQAIDSRSFMDHSEEIARAVREAMLESHMLSDVVGEY
jgi:hypothetical protein